MYQQLLRTICISVSITLCSVLSAFADEHQTKHKTGHYRTINQHQLHKIQQNCQPDKYISLTNSNHEILFTNCEGRQLRGRLDSRGYGELKDDEGNIVKVQPGQVSM